MPSTPLVSVSEIPRLDSIFVSIAFCFRRGHLLMWPTADLLEEAVSLLWFFQPHSQESNETILFLKFQRFKNIVNITLVELTICGLLSLHLTTSGCSNPRI